jgi:predicted metal-dependent hydrolase
MAPSRKRVLTSLLAVGEFQVTVVRKAIRRMNLRVCAPDGHLRVAAPLGTPDEAVRRLVLDNLAWVQRHQERLKGVEAPVAPELENGQMVWFLGRPYQLQLFEHLGAPSVALRGLTLEMLLRPGASLARRRALLRDWYRQQLETLVPPLLAQWQATLGVRLKDWGLKTMRTRWGSCGPEIRRIWLNLDLARKPLPCLEYVIVHELNHLRHRNHDARFSAAMDEALPDWRDRKALLNSALEPGGPTKGN